MRGWLVLSCTLAIGVLLGVSVATKGPALVVPYLPKSFSGQHERIDGEVVRKQLKVATAQGPMLVTFSQKVVELDLLLEPGDGVELITPGRPLSKIRAGAVAASSPPSTSSGSPQGSQEKTGR
jgi:hypothetical protein